MSDAQKKPSPEPKLRWYQFSLKSLLIFMLVSGLFFGWVGKKVHEAEKQKDVVEWVEERGGYVDYDYEAQFVEPPGPDWLRNIIGIDYFCNVERVTFKMQIPIVNMGLTEKEESTLLDIVEAEVTPLHSLGYLKSIRFENLRPTYRLGRKFQQAFPKCKISWHTTVYLHSGENWCEECGEWHIIGLITHTAPDSN